MTNTINNVPRELLADLLGNDHDKRIMAERHLLAMLANAPSPACVDGLEVVAYADSGGALYTAKLLKIMAVDYVGCDPLCRLSDAQAIIDGLAVENHQLRRELNLRQSQIESSGRIAERAQRFAVQLRTERDQQAQRIGELEGLLRGVHGWIDESARVYRHNSTSVMLYRIDAALSAGKEGE